MIPSARVWLVLTAVALGGPAALAGITATVEGGDRPWIVVFPLSSDEPVQTRSGGAGEVIHIGDVRGPTLVCVGADHRATVCERILPEERMPRRFLLDEGRHVIGRVLVGRRGAGDVSVSIRPAAIEARRPLVIPLARGADRWVKSVRTEVTGRFDIEHLAPGRYVFEITTSGGRTEESVVEIPSRRSAEHSRMFALPELRLAEGVRLVVEVRSDDGAPIPKAGVAISQVMPGGARRVFETNADADGVVELDGIEPAVSGIVDCSAAGFTRWSESFGSLPPLVSCTLGRFSSITGTVSEAGGARVSRATVELLRSEQRATTDANGAFVLKDVPAGTHAIRASSATSGVVIRELMVGNGVIVDAGDLVLGPVQTMRGRVVDAVTAEPITGASVTVVDPLNGASTLTDRDGVFALAGDATMPTRVRVAADRYAAKHSILRTTADSVSTIALSRPGALEIQTWDDASGEPCVGCTMIAYAEDAMRGGMTDAEGRVRLHDLAPGRYRVTRERVTATSTGVSVRGGMATQSATVRAGETTYVEIGSRTREIRVMISPPPSSDWELVADGPTRLIRGTAEGPGVFSFRRQAGERYALRLHTATAGVALGVVPEDFTGELLSFERGNTQLQVRLTKHDLPAAGIHVRLLSLSGSLAAWAITDASGWASIPHLQAGMYAVVAEERPLGSVSVSAAAATSLVRSID